MFKARDRLAQVADGLGLLTLSATLRRSSPRLVILAYHRVLDVPDEEGFGSDLELVSASVDSFREQMRFLSRHFRVITFSELEALRGTGRDLEQGTAIVTFDDGFEDNYLNAFPVLKSLQMAATVFLATGFIDRQEPFWFEALAQAVLRTDRAVSLPDWRGVQGDTPMAARRVALNELLRYLKGLPDSERRDRVKQVMAASGLRDDITGSNLGRPLNWGQIREMAAGGIEFGSHTVDHPVLARADEAQIQRELLESKLRIEQELGTRINSLAYPVGGSNAFDSRVRRIAAAVGYRFAVSYVPGTNSLRHCDFFALRRSHVERYTTLHRFKAEVAIADLLP